MSETEKITINLGPVDLGRIDILVEQGVYTNRTDMIRTAIRNQIDRHDPVIQDAVVRRSYTLGIIGLARKDLEAYKRRGAKAALRVVGMLLIENDVTPELAIEAIDSIVVRGVFRAPKAVRDALGDRVSQ